jgi:hypothetical protein
MDNDAYFDGIALTIRQTGLIPDKSIIIGCILLCIIGGVLYRFRTAVVRRRSVSTQVINNTL